MELTSKGLTDLINTALWIASTGNSRQPEIVGPIAAVLVEKALGCYTDKEVHEVLHKNDSKS